MQLGLSASLKSPPNTPSTTKTEDQSDFGTAKPDSDMKAFATTVATSLVNEGERGSMATSMTQLSSTTSLGSGVGELAVRSRMSSSRELAPEELQISNADHSDAEKIVTADSRPPSEKSALSTAASLDGERRTLMGGSDAEEAASGGRHYGSMVDSGGVNTSLRE